MTPVSVVNVPALVPAVPDEAGPDDIDPATSSRIGSITYDWEDGGYNHEWESRADFNEWLTREQAAIEIEIQLSKTRQGKGKTELYSKCETYCCACNRTGGKSCYMKKTTRERKIESKRLEGGCPC